MTKVTIKSSGHVFDVKPSQTVLEAAVEGGINLPYGCRTGAVGHAKAKWSQVKWCTMITKKPP